MRRVLSLVCSTALACSALVAAPATAAVNNVVLTVHCAANPETLRVTNNRSGNITITKVGSTYQKRSGEPYTVHKVLGSGKSITYRFGTGSGAHKLTNQFIFSTNSSEKARITTNLGAVTKHC